MKKLVVPFILLCVALIQTSCNTYEHASEFENNTEKSKIFYNPTQNPYYINGGDKGLLNDLYSAILKNTPPIQDSVKSRAVVRYSVSKDGIIDPNSIKVVRNKSVPEDYMEAAIKAIKNLGAYEPGKINLIHKKVNYYLPIIYPVPLDKIINNE